MARDFKTIGVVGLGTMGAGITEVFARNGYSVVGVEVDDEAVARGRQHLEHSTGRAVSRGKLSEDERRSCTTGSPSPPRWRTSRTPTSSSRRSSSRSRSRRQIFRELDGIVVRGRDPRHQHLLALGHRDLHRQPRTPAASSACTSSTRRRCRASSRSCGPSSPRPRCSRTSRRWCATLGKNPVVCGDKAGFIANTLLFGYLNHAVSMYENRYASREDIDAAMRFGCGYPMGPLALLDLIGLDTAYEILDTMYRQGRDRLHAPGADPQADGHRRPARPQDRPGLLHLRGRRQPGRRRRRRDARRPTTSRSSSTTSSCVGVVGTGTMATGIVEVFAKAGYDVVYVGRSPGQGRRRAGDDRALARQGDPARQARGVGQGRGARPADRHHLARRPRPRSTSPSRRSPRTSRSRPRCSRTSTRSASRARSWPPPPRRCRSSQCAQATKPAAGRRRDALLQPGADHEAGRGGLAPSPPATTSPRPPGRCARRSARSPSRAATAPGSSSTRCCSPTSTTRSRCSRRTTRPPTTSTPR